MKTIINPLRSQWQELLQRPAIDNSELFQTVQQILNAVKTDGDEAIKACTSKFDGYTGESMLVSQQELLEAEQLLTDDLKKAIQTAKENIEKFHRAQKVTFEKIETTPGVTCWQKSVAIEKVGLYIPGGSAPLFSTVLMLAIPAKIAGCSEVVLCTPPSADGSIHPAIRYAAAITGVSKVIKAGGIQAIAGMAYGTESIPKVSKIFGPGNQYVTAAKQLVNLGDVAIDMPAGPSEVLIMADETANITFVAADLLSQAEHGADSQVILLTTSQKLMEQVNEEIDNQLQQLPRKEIAIKALQNSKTILLNSIDEMLEMSNTYAPEHLIIMTSNAQEVAEKVINAGSVFIGGYTPESAGDYASGTNHTLPTNGYAKAYSGVNLDSFTRKITFQQISAEGLKTLGPVIETMAAAEMLDAHKNAVTIRLKTINNQ
jgi:histidinol dehydrogenase